MSALHTYTELRNLLGEHVRLYRKSEELIEKDDLEGAKALLVQLSASADVIEAKQATLPTEFPFEDANFRSVLIEIRELAEYTFKLDSNLCQWMMKKTSPELGDDKILEKDGGPAMFVDRMLPAGWNYDKDVIVVAGTGSQKCVTELVNRNQKRIIVFDKNPGASYETSVKVVKSLQDAYAVLHSFSQPSPGQIANISNSIDKTEFALTDKERDQFIQLAHSLIQHNVSMVKTIEDIGPTWIPQGIKNLAKLPFCAPITAIADRFKGMPMIIVAPGPSLNRTVEQVKALKGKALIVGFSQSLKAMQAKGLSPDLVIVVDPGDLLYHFDGCDVTKTEGLVLGVTCHPGLFELPFKRFFYYAGNSDLETWITDGMKERCPLAAAGTVAHSTLSLGFYLHCNPIVITGMDLAFTGDRAYTDGGCDSDTEVVSNGPMVAFKGHRHQSQEMFMTEVPGYFGGQVRTSALYAQFLRFFEGLAGNNNQHTRIINATEGGAYIMNMEHMLMEDVERNFVFEDLGLPALLDDAYKMVEGGERKDLMLAHVKSLRDKIELAVFKAHACVDVLQDVRAGTSEHVAFTKAQAEFIEAVNPISFLSLLHQKELKSFEELAKQAKTQAESMDAAEKTIRMLFAAANIALPLLAEAESKLSDDKFVRQLCDIRFDEQPPDLHETMKALGTENVQLQVQSRGY